MVNAPAVTTTTAKLTFTEPETNGSLRFYCGTASFTAADTAEAALDSIAEESRRWDSLLSDYSRHSEAISLRGRKGDTLASAGFLKQFPGKPAAALAMGKDFDAVSSASESCRLLNASIKRAAWLAPNAPLK